MDDIVRQAVPYFADTISYDPEAIAKAWKSPDETVSLLRAAREQLASAAQWTEAELERTRESDPAVAARPRLLRVPRDG